MPICEGYVTDLDGQSPGRVSERLAYVGLRGSGACLSTFFAAIFNLLPYLIPLLAPLEWLLANDANLFRKMWLFVSHSMMRW